MNPIPFIALTGGPCGGKTTLIEELGRDPVWRERISALPESIFLMHSIGVSPDEKLFQRLMVHMQKAMEDGLGRGFGPQGLRIILCHRGTLDPLAYWLDRGWPEEDFYLFTETRREEHFRRYAAVIHLVTAADGAIEHYKRYPDAHRPETPEQAIRIDRLLQRAWGEHPRYFRIDNTGKDWAAKSREIKNTIRQIVW